MNLGIERDLCLINKIKVLIILIAVNIVFSGCFNPLPSGNYQGTLSVHDVEGLAPLGIKPVPVAIYVSYSGPRASKSQRGEVIVRDFRAKHKIMRPLVISNLSTKGFDLKIPDLIPAVFHLNLVKDKSKERDKRCFYGELSNYEVDLCMEDESFNLDIAYNHSPRLSLNGTRFDPEKGQDYEIPKDFTVNEAVDLLLRKNYDLRIERLNLDQLRMAMKTAYLNLIPHLTYTSITGTALGAATADPTAVVGVVGDITPFLFPSRWIGAKNQQWQYHAERVTDILLKANNATAFQILAIQYVAQRDYAKDLHEIYDRIKDVVSKVRALEAQGKLSVGSADTAQVVEDDTRIAMELADNQLGTQQFGLSQIIGLNNPEAVKDMDLGPETPTPEDIPLLNDTDLAKEEKKYGYLAIERSFEIRQSRFLIRGARMNEALVFTNWIDPYGDPTNPLGFSLATIARSSRDVIKTLLVRIGDLKEKLSFSAMNTVSDRNVMKQYYNDAVQSQALRKQRMNDMLTSLDQMYSGTNDPKEVIYIAVIYQAYLIDYMNGLKYYYAARSGAQMDQVTLDRVALEGVYDRLLPRLINPDSSESMQPKDKQMILDQAPERQKKLKNLK